MTELGITRFQTFWSKTILIPGYRDMSDHTMGVECANIVQAS